MRPRLGFDCVGASGGNGSTAHLTPRLSTRREHARAQVYYAKMLSSVSWFNMQTPSKLMAVVQLMEFETFSSSRCAAPPLLACRPADESSRGGARWCLGWRGRASDAAWGSPPSGLHHRGCDRHCRLTPCARHRLHRCIFQEGEKADKLYIVVSGRVGMFKQVLASRGGEDEKSILLAEFSSASKNAWFGEAAVIANTVGELTHSTDSFSKPKRGVSEPAFTAASRSIEIPRDPSRSPPPDALV